MQCFRQMSRVAAWLPGWPWSAHRELQGLRCQELPHGYCPPSAVPVPLQLSLASEHHTPCQADSTDAQLPDLTVAVPQPCCPHQSDVSLSLGRGYWPPGCAGLQLLWRLLWPRRFQLSPPPIPAVHILEGAVEVPLNTATLKWHVRCNTHTYPPPSDIPPTLHPACPA